MRGARGVERRGWEEGKDGEGLEQRGGGGKGRRDEEGVGDRVVRGVRPGNVERLERKARAQRLGWGWERGVWREGH